MHLFVRSRYRICFFLWIFKLILELFGQCGMFCLHFIYEHVSSIFRPILNRDLVYISAHFIHTTQSIFQPNIQTSGIFGPLYKCLVYIRLILYRRLVLIFRIISCKRPSYILVNYTNAPSIFRSNSYKRPVYLSAHYTNVPSIFRPIIETCCLYSDHFIQTSRLYFGSLYMKSLKIPKG